MTIHPQAAALNDTIRRINPHVFDMLSRRGRSIYFPKLGILSQSADAAGKRINATIGTALEDDGGPMCLSSLSERIKLDPKNAFHYAPSFGRPDIRAAWKAMLTKKNPSLNPAHCSLPVVSCALTHGLSMAGYLFVNEGDTIILPDLYWENYELLFNLAYGSSFATFPMFCGETGGFNTDALETLVCGGAIGKKIVLLNFPNNPTGYTAGNAEAVRIRDILVKSAARGNDIVVLIDDAYFGLVYEEGIMTESLFTLLSCAHPRILAIKFDGPTKEDYVWGFRIGFVTFGTAQDSPEFYAALEAKLGGAIRGSISNASNLGQSLLLAAWNDTAYDLQKTQKYETLKRRYLKLRQILTDHGEYGEQFAALPFNSGYFMCIKLKNGNAEQVRQRLLSEYSTGVIAQDDLIRIAFSSTPCDMLEPLFDNIYRASKDICMP